MQLISALPLHPFAGLAALVVLYTLGLSVYRLYLHPLSRFPGPRLAALTKWYEFYYDVVVGGRFTFHLQDLHKQYGPIIRINPNEIHIDDPDFYEEFYTKQGKQDKYHWMSGYFGNESSIFTTMDHDLHRARRAPMQPLLSRSRIIQLQSIVREKNTKMLAKIAKYRGSGQVLPIEGAFMAMSEDVIFELCFGQCYNVLDVPNFEQNLARKFKVLSLMGHLAAHLPLIPKTMMSFPESWLETMDPIYATIFGLKRDLEQWADDVKQGRSTTGHKVNHTTVIQAIVDSNLPAREKESIRLRDEAHVVVGAGLITTGWAASVATFHVLDNRHVFEALRKELEEAIPDPTVELDWLKLEKLPYLTGCVKEGIRLSVGESNRSPRLSDNPTIYKQWTIPPRTPVSMTIADVSFNERVFPSPQKFIPERWVDAGHNLDKYSVAFGKGSRSCLGMQLAYAELYYMIAGVFRSFDFELYETDISDVTFQHDYAIPFAKLDSKGVRVTVKPNI